MARILVSIVLALAFYGAAPAPLRVDGRFFVVGERTFRPLFASTLSILVRSDAQRARVLDEVRALGFNGVRVFAGALEWADQTPARAREILPQLLQEASSRDLYVEVTAITDSATGYDVEQHLRAVAAMCAAAPNCLLEAANEYYHPTQSAVVQDPARLAAIARRAIKGPLWALGAPPFDRPQAHTRERGWPVPVGDYVTVHLGRNGGWEQLARLRELARVSELTRKPLINNEPIGAAERAERDRRESDPDFFFAMGAISRLLELGTVFHSEDGRYARPLGPVQRRCAEAFVAGWRSIDTTDRLRPLQPGAAGAPVTSVSNARHIFIGEAGRSAWMVMLTGRGAPGVRWRTGWTHRMVAEREGVTVIQAKQK